MTVFTRFLCDERGATAIEYALIAALAAIMAIGGITAFASSFGQLMFGVSDELTAAAANN